MSPRWDPRSRATWLLAGYVVICLAALVAGQVQRQGDDLLGEMHTQGCTPASLATITPGLWNSTSAFDIARAAETWQFHNIEAAGGPVEPVALCAGRRLSGSEPTARRFTSPKEVYDAQLGLLSAAQIALTGMSVGGASVLARRRIPLKLTLPLSVLGMVSWAVERHELRVQIDRAWADAVGNGLVAAAELDVDLVNWAARLRLGTFALLSVLIAVAVGQWVLVAVRAGVEASSGIRLNLALAAGSTVAVLLFPQVDDAIRRWGSGQMLIAFLLTLAMGAVLAATCARPPVVLAVECTPLQHGESPLRHVAPSGALSAAVLAIGFVVEARGLMVLAGIIGASAVLSLLLDRHAAWEARVLPPAETASARPWLVGIAAALPTAALGFAAIRVSATDQLGIRGAGSVLPLLVGSLAVLCSGLLASSLVGFHRRLQHRQPTPLGRLMIAAAASLGIGVVAAVSDLAELGAIGVFFGFAITLLIALALLHALGDALLSHRSWWRYTLPPALLVLGVRRGPFPLLLGIWFLTLPLVGALGYHDVSVVPLAGSPFEPPAVQTLDEIAEAWVDRQDVSAQGRLVPALTVAASGGGIRAAYWAAAVLDCIVDGETVGDDPCAGRAAPGDARQRRDSLIMLSGVSGGALGLVSYVAQTDTGWQVPTGAAPPRWYDQRFDADFQAEVLSEMLTGDVAEYFLRTGRGDDRARALEKAFEEQWPDGELARRFLTGQNSGEPFLFLHGFSVEDGCRVNLSVLDSNGLRLGDSCTTPGTGPAPLLHGTTDLADFLCGDGDLRRSTVALLSARFPYVTPSGHLTTQDCHRTPAETNIVDGGYRGSSGSSAIAELWPSLETSAGSALAAVSPQSCLLSIHLQIDSHEFAANAATANEPNEALIPLLAVSRVGGGVDAAARSATQALFAPEFYFRIQPVAHPGDAAPLGWTLSRSSRADLQDQLRVNRDQIEALRLLLDVPSASRATASNSGCAPAISNPVNQTRPGG